jgi:hypothetical protein
MIMNMNTRLVYKGDGDLIDVNVFYNEINDLIRAGRTITLRKPPIEEVKKKAGGTMPISDEEAREDIDRFVAVQYLD